MKKMTGLSAQGKGSIFIYSGEITNKMQPCNGIYYSTVYWRLNMFRAAYRSSSGALTVFAASGLHTHVVNGRSQVWVETAFIVKLSWASHVSKSYKCSMAFLIIKPTRCTNLWNSTFSDNSSVHHQESVIVHTAMACVIQVCWHIPLLCVQWKTPDDGQRNCPKHVDFHFKKKFEKLVHLIGFILRNLTGCTVTWTSKKF
jgi:hypothetical protein